MNLKKIIFSTRFLLAGLALLIFRVVVAGLMMINHGWGKLSGYQEKAAGFGDPLGVGPEISMGLTVFAEFFCSCLIIIGLFTRWASIPLIITMTVAGFIVHAADPLQRKELAFIYLVCFILILLLGPGKYSMDRLIEK